MSCDLVFVCLLCRKGAQFVEAWLDGFAFTELSQKQEAVASHREELERQRKQLIKRKPGSSSSGGQGQGGSGSGGKASRGGKQASAATGGGSGGSDDGFAKPANLVSLTPQEYMERDELFKLRAALLKKVIITVVRITWPFFFKHIHIRWYIKCMYSCL